MSHMTDSYDHYVETGGTRRWLTLAADELGAAAGFRACADPAGHPFCLTWGDQA